MRGYNTGWCNFCNGSVCPCGSCGCSSSCGCSCGRKTVLQQSKSSCCGSTSSGTKFCKEPTLYLTSNFTVPAANIEVDISVSNSEKMYEGQGIKIGSQYFQVTEIVDSRNIKIAHDGTAAPGLVFTAINSSYSCYVYPIYYVGIVELFGVVSPDGVDENYAPVVDSLIESTNSFTYGYLGPNKIEFNFYATCEFDNPSDFISLDLPNASAQPEATFSAVILVAGVPTIAVAYKVGTKLIVGYGGGVQFPTGSGTIVQVSGSYGL